MPTLKEVSELAGVSVATASLALNNNVRIRESTRNKVLACAKALNYIPNRIECTLKNGKTNAIALLAMTSTRHEDIAHETTLLYLCSREFCRSLTAQADHREGLTMAAAKVPKVIPL